MNMIKYSFLGVLFLTLLGCKKEQIEPDVPSGELPVFSVNGNIDGTPIRFDAGVDGAFLTTYTLMNEGVERYSGKIEKGNDYVEFGLHNGNLFLPSSNIAQAGAKINLASPPNVVLFNLNQFLFGNSPFIESINIKVNGVSVGESLTLYEPGIYDICVDVDFLDSQQPIGTICNTIVLGYTDFGDFKINHNSSGSGQVQASINSGLPISNVKWFVGNSYVSTGNNFSGSISNTGQVLKAEVTFTNGVVAEREVFVNGYNQAAFVEDVTNFKSSLDEVLMRDFKAEFSVFSNNTLYTHEVSTSGSPEVTITGFSYYGLNSNGKEVYKLTGTINTQMKNNTTSNIVNAEFNVAIGIEIP